MNNLVWKLTLRQCPSNVSNLASLGTGVVVHWVSKPYPSKVWKLGNLACSSNNYDTKSFEPCVTQRCIGCMLVTHIAYTLEIFSLGMKHMFDHLVFFADHFASATSTQKCFTNLQKYTQTFRVTHDLRSTPRGLRRS